MGYVRHPPVFLGCTHNGPGVDSAVSATDQGWFTLSPSGSSLASNIIGSFDF